MQFSSQLFGLFEGVLHLLESFLRGFELFGVSGALRSDDTLGNSLLVLPKEVLSRDEKRVSDVQETASDGSNNAGSK